MIVPRVVSHSGVYGVDETAAAFRPIQSQGGVGSPQRAKHSERVGFPVWGLHPAQITRWKQPLEEGVDEIFSRGQHKRVRAEEALRARLYQEIGELKVELDWLKSQVSPL